MRVPAAAAHASCSEEQESICLTHPHLLSSCPRATQAAQDGTLIVLVIAAVLSLIAGALPPQIDSLRIAVAPFALRSVLTPPLCGPCSPPTGLIENAEEGWHDGTAILFAVLLVINVSAYNDYNQSLQFRALNADKKNIPINVIRDGCRKKVSVYDLVVGDIVFLAVGDQIPADGLVVSAQALVRARTCCAMPPLLPMPEPPRCDTPACVPPVTARVSLRASRCATSRA